MKRLSEESPVEQGAIGHDLRNWQQGTTGKGSPPPVHHLLPLAGKDQGLCTAACPLRKALTMPPPNKAINHHPTIAESVSEDYVSAWLEFFGWFLPPLFSWTGSLGKLIF